MEITISYSVAEAEIERTEQLLPQIEDLLSAVSSEITQHKEIIAYLNESKVFNGNSEEIMIDLYLTNNSEIQSLNLQYRGKDAPTDVLSFAMQEAEETIVLPVLHLGEIIISIDKLIEQASINEHSNAHEFVFLLCHGILHLLGMHHDTDEAYQRIITIQKDVLNKVLS